MDHVDKFRTETVLEGVEVPKPLPSPEETRQASVTEHTPMLTKEDVARDYLLLCEALEGSNGPEQQRIAEKGLSWVALMLRKNADYGSTVFTSPKLTPHLDAGTAILVRMSDKIDRLTNLLNGHKPLVDEKLEDTLSDLAVYGLLYLVRNK